MEVVYCVRALKYEDAYKQEIKLEVLERATEAFKKKKF